VAAVLAAQMAQQLETLVQSIRAVVVAVVVLQPLQVTNEPMAAQAVQE
jgi:hypothetical protein